MRRASFFFVLIAASSCVEDELPLSIGEPRLTIGDGAAGARDELHGELIFSGDETARGESVTWVFNGEEWNVVGVGGPPARRRAAMAWHPVREAIVLFGGFEDGSSEMLGDTWAWNGESWAPIDGPGPAPRYGHRLIWVPQKDAMLLIGGIRDTCRGPGCQDAWWLDENGWREDLTAAH